MAFRSRPIPNIIQGVTQQTPQSCRDSQCAAQQDCVNSPRLGVVARSGFDVGSFVAGLSVPGAFTYELVRGSTEHYLMVLYHGTLKIYDLNTFALCSVTPLGGSTYLNNPGGGVQSRTQLLGLSSKGTIYSVQLIWTHLKTVRQTRVSLSRRSLSRAIALHRLTVFTDVDKSQT